MWRYGVQARRLESLVRELRNNAIRFREQVLANVFVNGGATSFTESSGKTPSSFPQQHL